MGARGGVCCRDADVRVRRDSRGACVRRIVVIVDCGVYSGFNKDRKCVFIDFNPFTDTK